MVVTLEEAVRIRIRECAEEASNSFKGSVRPIYASKKGTNPELIGSCLLLDLDGQKFVATAAHIIDWSSSHALYVAGVAVGAPTQIYGEIHASSAPQGDRVLDKDDVAIWQLSTSAKRDLSGVTFFQSGDISRNQNSSANRCYMAMGYPLSRNRGGVDNKKRTIRTVLWKYSSHVQELLNLAAELKISGKNHFFLKYEKYSRDDTGRRVSSVNPKGLSGGALIDLGNFGDVSNYDPDKPCCGSLCGMVIERKKKHQALIAIKIQKVLWAINRQYGVSTPL